MSDPRLPASYLQPGSSSFSDFLAQQAPDLLPGRRSVPQGNAADLAPHGTTIVAVAFPGGVLLAGDRRATMGNIIASRDIEKVFPTDEFSAAGIAGTDPSVVAVLVSEHGRVGGGLLARPHVGLRHDLHQRDPGPVVVRQRCPSACPTSRK